MNEQVAEYSFQEIREMFAEIARRFQDTDKRFQETDKKFQETERLLKERSQETERLLKEKSQETERLLKEKSQETERLLKEISQETERLLKEISQETEKEIKELAIADKELRKSIGEITGKWSRFVEGMVAPGVIRLFNERGIPIREIYQRVKSVKDGGMEIDILAVNTDHAILIEVKSTLSVEDVREHLERIEKFKSLFPLYKDKKVLGAVAGIVIDEGADKFAYRKGLFVIAQRGDTVEFLNDDKFKPAVW